MFPETGKAIRGTNSVEKVDVRDCTQSHLGYRTIVQEYQLLYSQI